MSKRLIEIGKELPEVAVMSWIVGTVAVYTNAYLVLRFGTYSIETNVLIPMAAGAVAMLALYLAIELGSMLGQVANDD